mmetsp:Transcript_1161/g.1919  ORF Transcript_1161/g.1919 Transcript_1161/m.1919 type:complete len:201 (-) Transcript_1161:135-737(-)
MDTEEYTPFICGEESFGTGSNHVREKDGIWAVCAWLNVLAAKNVDSASPLVGIDQIVGEHWSKYGRNYYGRYDYEGVESEKAAKLMSEMTGKMGNWPTDAFTPFRLDKADVFEYKDPVDGSVSKNQGIRFILDDGSRIIFRLSGTGVSGATIRLYIEKYEPPSGNLRQNALEVIKPLAAVAISVSQMEVLTGRDAPSVMT